MNDRWGKTGAVRSQPPEPKYIPALRFHWLTPYDDVIAGATIRERSFKQADLEPGQRVLDLASGTGTLAIWIKQYQPHATYYELNGQFPIGHYL